MTTSATSASDADGGSEPTDAPAVSLDELYHLDGVKVSYDSYRFSKKYGDQIKADKGQTLLIVSFRLKNESGKKKKVSLMDRTGIEYKLDVDGEQYSPQISILANGGMNYFEDTIEKGKSEKAVLIFRMDQGKKSASSIHLTITEGNENASVEIK
jgi:hypothetical protein